MKFSLRSIFFTKRSLTGLSLITHSVSACYRPIAKGMESMGLGPSFAGLYLGASAHADDVRTVTSSLHCLRQQVGFVLALQHRMD